MEIAAPLCWRKFVARVQLTIHHQFLIIFFLRYNQGHYYISNIVSLSQTPRQKDCDAHHLLINLSPLVR
jgi:hypothetical protein